MCATRGGVVANAPIARRPAYFGRSLRDPDVDRPRLREVGSGRSPSASLGLARNTPAFFWSFVWYRWDRWDRWDRFSNGFLLCFRDWALEGLLLSDDPFSIPALIVLAHGKAAPRDSQPTFQKSLLCSFQIAVVSSIRRSPASSAVVPNAMSPS